jgi:hypothetical protein
LNVTCGRSRSRRDFLFLVTVATSAGVCLSSREELCLIELQWEQPLAANDGRFWLRDIECRPARQAHIVSALWLVIALAFIAAIALRVGVWGQARGSVMHTNTAHLGLPPCVASSKSGWRHSGELEAVCAQ